MVTPNRGTYHIYKLANSSYILTHLGLNVNLKG